MEPNRVTVTIEGPRGDKREVILSTDLVRHSPEGAFYLICEGLQSVIPSALPSAASVQPKRGQSVPIGSLGGLV